MLGLVIPWPAGSDLLGLRNPGDGGKQLIVLDVGSGSVTAVGGSVSAPLSSVGGVDALDASGNRVFFVAKPLGESDDRLFIVDTQTGAVLGSPTIAGSNAAPIQGLAFDEAEGVLYGLRNPGDGGKQLIVLDVGSGSVTAVGGSISAPLSSVGGVDALDASGNRVFFVAKPLGESDDRLFIVDTQTGAVLGSPTIAGSNAAPIQGLAFDEAEGVHYGLRNPGDGGKQLIVLDVGSGSVTAVGGSVSAPLSSVGGVDALDASGNRIFFVAKPLGESDDRLFIVDTQTGAVLGSPTIAGSNAAPIQGLAFDAIVDTPASPPDTTESSPPDTTESSPPDTTESSPPDTTESSPPDTTESSPPNTTESSPPDTTESSPPDTTEVASTDTGSVFVVYQNLDFGPVVVGESFTLPLTVINTTQVSVTTLIVTFIGSKKGFSFEPKSLTVAAGGTGTIQITFTPSVAGAVSADLLVNFGSTFMEATLAGKGTAPQPKLEIDRLDLDFGSDRLGSESTVAITVTNTGRATLHVTDIELDPEFHVSPTNFDLEPGLDQIVSLTFLRTIAGQVDGDLRITSNDSQSPGLSLSLKGNSTTPPAVLLNPLDRLDYGKVEIGSAAGGILLVENRGTDVLHDTLSALDEPFALDGSGLLTVAGDGASEVSIAFSPDSVGSYEATLLHTTNDPLRPSVVTLLKGRGVRDLHAGPLSGRLFFADGNPLIGTVTLTDPEHRIVGEVSSDADGRFVFELVAEGAYRVYARKLAARG